MQQVIVLTGGATGIGAATAARLRAAGCELHVLDVRAPAAELGAHFVACDLGRRQAIDAVLDQLPGRVDALVNVAGIPGPEPAEAVVAVNFLGLRHLSEALLPRMAEGGSIVNVASSAARDWRDNAPLVGELLATRGFDAGLEWLAAQRERWIENPYKFSKQCVAAWTYRAAGLAHPRGVRVNCVNPGSTETALTPAFRQLVGAARYDWSVAQLGRAGRPEDIAPVVEFLAIGPCRWLNGVEILVDGGYVAGLVDGWIDASQAPPAAMRTGH
jgi:NAD(P)-dependent dehydrogenase (short-subunit alcohol dehydrogenase family)